MTEFKKTWRLGENGALLGSLDIVSPWTGGITEAVVNTETGTVIAAHGASCAPFQLAMPPGTLAKMSMGDGTAEFVDPAENRWPQIVAVDPGSAEGDKCMTCVGCFDEKGNLHVLDIHETTEEETAMLEGEQLREKVERIFADKAEKIRQALFVGDLDLTEDEHAELTERLARELAWHVGDCVGMLSEDDDRMESLLDDMAIIERDQADMYFDEGEDDEPEPLPNIDRSPQPFWKNTVSGDQDNE